MAKSRAEIDKDLELIKAHFKKLSIKTRTKLGIVLGVGWHHLTRGTKKYPIKVDEYWFMGPALKKNFARLAAFKKDFDKKYDLFDSELDLNPDLYMVRIRVVNPLKGEVRSGATHVRRQMPYVSFAKMLPRLAYNEYSKMTVLSWPPSIDRRDSSRIWFLDTGSVRLVRANGKIKGKCFALPVNKNIDFLGNKTVQGLPMLYVANDFYRQKQQLKEKLRNIANIHYYLPTLLNTTLSYGDCSRAGSDKDALLGKWKAARKLRDNFGLDLNKLTFYDVKLLRSLAAKLAPAEFMRFYNYFIRDKTKFYQHLASYYSGWLASSFAPKQAYALYILARIGDDPANIIKDHNDLALTYIDGFLTFKPYHKLAMPYRSLRRLRDESTILMHKAAIKRAEKRFSHKQLVSDVVKTRRDFKPLVKIADADKRVRVIRTPAELIREGANQHNCLGTYTDAYIRRGCGIIVHLDMGKEQDSAEIDYDLNKKRYVVNQIYDKYDHTASQKAVDYLNNLLDKASKKK